MPLAARLHVFVSRSQAARQALECINLPEGAKRKDDGQKVGPAFGEPGLEHGTMMPPK